MTADTAVLTAEVRAARSRLDQLAGRAQQVVKDGLAAEAEIARLARQAGLYAKAGALLSSVGEDAQESARAMFEELATQALTVIFGDGFSVRLLSGESGGQVTLEPVIASGYGDGELVTPVMDARGGGMAAVTGFIFRLVMIMLTPSARKIVFLDESFSHVSESCTGALAEFLREVADRTGVQIVLITHDPVYAQHADARVRLELGSDKVTRAYEGESELCRCRQRDR